MRSQITEVSLRQALLNIFIQQFSSEETVRVRKAGGVVLGGRILGTGALIVSRAGAHEDLRIPCRQ